MYKIALVIVTFLLVVLANSPQAHAASTDAMEPGTKFRGKLVTNPTKSDRPVTAQRLLDPATATVNGTSVSVYDVWFDMVGDTDGDGYYHQFDVNFDIDTLYSSQRIYVIGELHGGTSQVLFQTDPYTLTGNSGSDSYQARVLLTDGYPSDQYELSLTVYDADTHAQLLHYDGQNNYQLATLYLEDSSRESAAMDNVSVYELGFELSSDLDGDGYFTEIAVDLDADAPGQQRWVYARISLIDPHNDWTEIKTSNDFLLQDYSSNDHYYTRLSLDYGFDPARYRLAVQIYDANSGSLLITSMSPSSTPLHMESIDWDNDAYVVVIEEEYYASGSGGSTSLFLLVMLSLFLLANRYRKSVK